MAFTGLIILFCTLGDYALYRSAKQETGKDLLKLRPGHYAFLTFDKLLLNKLGYPYCGIFGYYDGNYDRFVIADKDVYIQVEFPQTGEGIRQIRNFSEGQGEAVTVLIKGIRSDTIKVDDDFAPDVNDRPMCNTVFREIDKAGLEAKYKRNLLVAGALLAVSIILLYTPIGIGRVKEESQKDRDHREMVRLQNNYHQEAELARALKRKEELLAKQRQMKWKALLYFLISLISGALFIRLYVRFEETFPIYSALITASVFYFGLIHAWKALLNSEWYYALPISKRFSLDSFPVRLEETSILIGKLRREIDKK